MTLDEMIHSVNDLQNACWGNDSQLIECDKRKDNGCLQCEEDRPLSRAEKAKGWAKRPWYAYDADKLCRGCRIYWMLGNVANDLREEQHWQRVIEEENKRKTVTISR